MTMKEQLLARMDEEIKFALTTDMPIFVMGLRQARSIIEKFEEELNDDAEEAYREVMDEQYRYGSGS